MNKTLPYILVAFALVGGFFLKSYLDISKTEENEPETKEEVNDKIANNKIINEYSSFLIYPKKNVISPFSLVDHFNQPFNNKNFKGRWNLIFTGYTSCPDVCPTTLAEMAKVYQQIPEKYQQRFQFIFLSVDPKRDTPEHLKEYISYFHDDFIALSGKKSQIDILIKNLGGIYTINQEEGEFYTVDHSARIFIVGPKTDRYGILDSSVIKGKNKEQLIKDLIALTDRRS